MRIYKQKTRNAAGVPGKAGTHRLDFFWKGKRCRLPGYSSLRQSEALGNRLKELMGVLASGQRPDESLVRWLQSQSPTMQRCMVRYGLLDGRFAGAGKPLAEHLCDWKKVILARGNMPQHAEQFRFDAQRIITLAKAVYLVDLTPSSVQNAIAAMRDGDAKTPSLALQTCNHALRAIKSFTRWLVADRRATEDALAHIKAFNVKTDRRHDRRALSDEEVEKLLNVVRDGGVREGVAPADRAMLYQVALGTGFRRGELASLTPASFHLDDDPPSITLKAKSSKHRREDHQQIRTDLAAVVKPWLQGKAADARLWSKLERSARMIREDLEAARAAWLDEVKDNAEAMKKRTESDFLAYRDAGGRFADFHCLRHTYISRLVNSGAPVKVAMELARHSTPTLTLGRYAHIGLHDAGKALAALPAFPGATPAEPQTQAAKMTGTDQRPVTIDAAPKTGPAKVDTKVDTNGVAGRIPANSGGAEIKSDAAPETPAKPRENTVFPDDSQRRRRDSSPRTTYPKLGLEDGCSSD